MDRSAWTVSMEDTLASVFGIDVCQLPIVSFPVSPAAVARYARFVTKDHYLEAVAIDYLAFEVHY